MCILDGREGERRRGKEMPGVFAMSEDGPPADPDGVSAWLAKRLVAAGDNDMMEIRQRVTNIETALQAHAAKIDALQSDLRGIKDALLTRGIVTEKDKAGQAVRAGGIGAVAGGVIYAIIELLGKIQ